LQQPQKKKRFKPKKGTKRGNPDDFWNLESCAEKSVPDNHGGHKNHNFCPHLSGGISGVNNMTFHHHPSCLKAVLSTSFFICWLIGHQE